MENIIGKYIGPNQIHKVEISDRKTFLGKEVLRLIYESGEKEEIPTGIAERLVTKEKTDLTDMRERFVSPLIGNIMAIMLEAEVKIIDLDYVMQKITMSFNSNIDLAIDMAMGKDQYTRTLADIQMILTNQAIKIKKHDRLQKKN